MTDQTESSLPIEENQKQAADASARQKRSRASGGGRFQQKDSKGESSLNFEELRELIELMAANGLTEFELERDSFRVHLKRDFGGSMSGENRQQQQTSLSGGQFPLPSVPPPSTDSALASPIAGDEQQDEKLFIITAPIVGTFYRSASPTSDSFVKAGSQVEDDTVVCIIEAMKLMNEIQAETTGEVVKIYVENGQPVEYGQKLFGIKQ